MLKNNTKARESANLFGAVLLFALIVAGLLHLLHPKNNTLDWLHSADWTHFAGAERIEKGVKITNTNRVITHSDTSPAQPSPPINIRGAAVAVSGDFLLSMGIEGVTQGATVQLYGEMPVIYDEWREERGSFQLFISDSELNVRIWDGSAAVAIDQRRFSVNLSDVATIQLQRSNGEIAISVNNLLLGSLPEHGIFNSGKIWFGADAVDKSNGWIITKLTVSSTDTKPISLQHAPDFSESYAQPDSLRNLAANHPRKLPIGAAISVNPLYTDERYRELALGQFSILTPENSMKPQAIHPKRGLYLFQDSDSLVEAAEAYDMSVHGHALIMPKANPEWMYTSPEAEREAILVDHVKTIMTHYKGRVAQWDVVNEPIALDDIDFEDGKQGLRRSMWLDALGERYIDLALRTARDADPEAKLFINDFGMENDGKRWDALVELIKRLQARGVPLDGIGFEAHVYHEPADTINIDSLRRHIRELAALGLESRISEIDVLGDDPAFQEAQYAGALEVCLSEPSCTSYGTWGITDLYGSTALSDRYPVIRGDSLLWDESYTPKPAYDALLNVLRRH